MGKKTAAVIGITGRVGTRVAKELLGRGYEVIGINRRPGRRAERCDFECTFVTADAGDEAQITEAVQGAQAVVMVTEPTREHPEQYPKDVMNALNAAKKAGASKFIIVLNFYALKAPDGRRMLEAAPEHPYFAPIEQKYEDAANLLKQETQMDWTAFAAPAEMVPYMGKTGVYRQQPDYLLVKEGVEGAWKEISRLSMEDMADCVANEVEDPKWHRQLISVAY